VELSQNFFKAPKRILTAEGPITLNTSSVSSSKLVNMKLFNRALNLALACGCLLTICQSANAYIDAGSGSYLLQILFAGLLGGVYFAKSAFGNLKAAVVRRVNLHKGDDSAAHVG